MSVPATSPNFGFLDRYDDRLVIAATQAERYFPSDPVTALMKVRQFGELLAQQVAARAGFFTSAEESQSNLLARLRRDANYPREVIDLFHDLRRVGNPATHQHVGDHATALAAIKVARQLAAWFHRTFGNDTSFKPGPFQPPRPPPDPSRALTEELTQLRAAHDASLTATEAARQSAAAADEARRSAEERAAAEAKDRAFWEQYAADTEAQRAELASQLAALQAAAAAMPATVQLARLHAAEQAAQAIDLDEADTRVLIDARLRARGWDADTSSIRHAAGSRPGPGRNLAVAEWPTTNGPADYALFVGTLCVGIVEAKRSRKNVMAAIDQTARYAQGFLPEPGMLLPAGSPWAAQSGQGAEPPFRVPFHFATNGRGYLKQIETQSGIWFRDARHPTNVRRAMSDWPTPDGLEVAPENWTGG